MAVWLPAGYRAEHELEVRRSRFITTLARVDDEAAARAVMAEVRGRYPDARHHCSAFVVEVPGAQPVERSSDDGEPAGTAGMPMLEVLRGEGVSQVVAVVTRYFGGVLLGTGGLVRAYSDSVSAALAAAPRVSPEVWRVYRLEVAHSEFGRAQAELIGSGLRVLNAACGAEVSLVLAARLDADVPATVARVLHGKRPISEAGTQVIEEPAG